MEGTQTLNRDNGVLQSQAEGSESDTGTPERLDPQVRSLPLPDHRQEKPSFHDLSLLGKTFFFIVPQPHPPLVTHIRTPVLPQPGTPRLVSSTCFFQSPPSGFTLPLPTHLPAQHLRPAFSLADPSVSAARPGRPSCKSPIFASMPRSSPPRPPIPAFPETFSSFDYSLGIVAYPASPATLKDLTLGGALGESRGGCQGYWVTY